MRISIALAASVLAVTFAACACHSHHPTPPSCTGDCDGNGAVSEGEKNLVEQIALGTMPVTACPPADANHDDQVTVDEFQAAALYWKNGCPR